MLVNLVQLRHDDLLPGIPLPFSVFDQDSRLVYAEGQVIDTTAKVDKLIRKGAYRAAANEEWPARDAREALPLAPGAQEFALEDIRLQVGDTLQLFGLVGRDRHCVKLIGYAPDGSVLVTAPTLAGRVLLVREGREFIVRAFSGRAAYGFSSVVNRVCSDPYPYLHLQFPKSVRGVAMRCEARIRLQVIASVIRICAPAEPAPAVISDLSPTGACIDARERLVAKGGMLRVSFRLTLGQDEVYFVSEAVVRSVRRERRGHEPGDLNFMHGVEFVGMQPNERLLLKTLHQRMAGRQTREEG